MAMLLAVVAGCAAPTAPAPEAARAVQVEACAEAVAAHVGKGAEAVAAEWTGTAEAGTAIVTVSDAQAGGAERIHTCEVDASGRVRAIAHPGA
jgi:hypothetical protein